jgi:hypothetical protein
MNKLYLFILKYNILIELVGAVLAIIGIIIKVIGIEYSGILIVPGFSAFVLLYLLKTYAPYPATPVSGLDVFLYKLICLLLFILNFSIMLLLMQWNGTYLFMLAAFGAFVVFVLLYIINIFFFKSNPKVIQNHLIRLLIFVFLALSINYSYQKQYEKKLPSQNTQVEVPV